MINSNNAYQYETSPRKLQPQPKTKTKKEYQQILKLSKIIKTIRQ